MLIIMTIILITGLPFLVYLAACKRAAHADRLEEEYYARAHALIKSTPAGD